MLPNVLKPAPHGARRLRPWQADLFAVVITAATFGLRYALSGQLAGQPTLVLFTVPIMVSAYLGGLRAGLISTLVAYLGASFFLLSPLHSFAIASRAERWLQFFIVLAGVVISALNEALHRMRRQCEAHEAKVARQSRLYAALSQVNQAIVWTPERDALFRKVCEVLVEFGGFHMAWIGWHDPARQVITPIASCGEGEDSLAGFEIFTDGRPGYDGPVTTAFLEGCPCISNDVQADPVAAAWHALFKQLGVFALAVFPIREKGEVVGTIVIRSGMRGFFQEKEVALLTEAAGDVSFGLDNLAREAERRRLVAELRTSEDRLRSYVDQAADCMFVHDASGQFLDVNPQACASLGYTRKAAAGDESLRGRDELRPASRTGSLEPDKPGQPHILHGCHRRKDGSTFPVEARLGCFDLDGQRCYFAMARDITERDQQEAATKRALERLNEAQRIGQIGDWEWNIATQDVFWSAQVFEIFGRDPALGPPRSFEETAALYERASAALLTEKVAHAIQSGEAPEV